MAIALGLSDDSKQWLEQFRVGLVGDLQRVLDEGIDRIGKVAGDNVDRAAKEFGTVAGGLLVSAQSAGDHILAGLKVQVDRLEGAKVIPGTIEFKLGT